MLGTTSRMKSLCRAIIWSACFLEMSDDDTVDPDSAVKALEDIASSLQEATDDEKKAFAIVCAEEADKLQRQTGPNMRKTAGFIRGLPKSLGLDIA
jgi:hypothetical protein